MYCSWGDGLIKLPDLPRDVTWFSNLYFSVVTFSTLGFGDITPLNWVGEALVMAEVFAGYVMLGVLISIFALKLVPPR